MIGGHTLAAMATLLLMRHGRTQANVDGVLAGRTPGVGLDETGRRQAEALGERLRDLPLAALVTSPIQRCAETAKYVPAATPVPEERLAEVKYGDWEGKTLKELAGQELWPIVQQHPSAVRFPGPDGESMAEMAHRATSAIRDWDARVTAEHGTDAIWGVISHGDLIKAIVADALGLHLDQFQRIVVDPCSVTVIRYTPVRPFVIRQNDVGGDLSRLVPEPSTQRDGTAAAESDAAVGGGVGS